MHQPQKTGWIENCAKTTVKGPHPATPRCLKFGRRDGSNVLCEFPVSSIAIFEG
jgi:hypothetical protein